MPGIGIGLGLGMGGGGASSSALSADKSTYLASVAAGALIATLADPYGSGSTFTVIGSAPATLTLASGGRILAGNGVQTAGAASTIVIRAAKGSRAVEEPLTFTAQGGSGPATLLPRFKAALAATASGAADTLVSYVSDSTGVAAGAGTASGYGAATGGARPLSPVAKLAALSQASLGVPGANDSFWGSQAIDGSHSVASVLAYDSRLSATVNAAAEWGFTGVTGALVGLTERNWANNGGTTPLSFAPGTVADTLDVYYIRGSGKGTFAVDAGGAALGTVDSAGANAVLKATVSGGPLAANTWGIRRTGAGASISIIGAVARSSAQKRVHWMNHSRYGGVSATFAATANSWSYLPALVTIGAHLYILRQGLNNINAGTTAAAYKTDLTNEVVALKAVGDVAISFLTPQDPAVRDPSSLTAAYYQAAKDVAAEQGVLLIDLVAALPTFASMQAAGHFFDSVHMKVSGYDLVAAAEMAAISAEVAKR